MRRFPWRTIPLSTLAVCLLAAPFARAAAPAEAGWTSSWLAPHTEEERQQKDFHQQLALAKKTGNYKPLLARADKIVREHAADPGAYTLRGVTYTACKQWDHAMADFNRAIQLADGRHNDRAVAAVLFFRATCYYYARRYDACATDLSTSIKINPRAPLAVLMLARVRACCPDAVARDGHAAVELSQRAGAMMGRRNAAVLDTLAAAYAEEGDFSNAEKTQQEAVRQAQSDGHWSPAERQEAAARLALYTRRQPFRATAPGKTAG